MTTWTPKNKIPIATKLNNDSLFSITITKNIQNVPPKLVWLLCENRMVCTGHVLVQLQN